MKAQLQESIQYLEDPLERINVEILDMQTGYAYSEEKGLWKVNFIHPDSNGMVTIDALFAEFRRVKSNSGYRKLEGYVTLPTASGLLGIDQSGEAAYNYFGLEAGDRNLEMGLYTGPSHNKRWYVFRNFDGNWVPEYWPDGGIPPGTQVFMREYVPFDNQYAFYIAYGSAHNTWIAYNLQGTKANGSGQKLRRVTSLLLNSGGFIFDDHWNNIYIATLRDMHLFILSDKLEAFSTPYTTAYEWNQYYNETVEIFIP